MVQTELAQQIKTHVFSKLLFEYRTVHEIMWKNIVEPERPQRTTWHMRIAGWIPKATNTHSEYVILLFYSNSGLYERASMLGYTYGACLFQFCSFSLTCHSF